MEMKDIKVNPLPAKTWHWVRMNDSELKIDLPDETPLIELGGDSGGLIWQREGLRWRPENRRNAPVSQPGSLPSKAVDWNGMETGMGDEFADLLNDRKSFVLNIPDGYISDDAAVITLRAPYGRAAGELLIHAGKDARVPIVIAIKGSVFEQASASDRTSASDPASSSTGSASESSDTFALQLKFYAEEGANVKIYLAQLLPPQGLSCFNIGGVCEERAQVELVDVSLGAENEYAGIAVRLEGDESSFSADMGYHVRNTQKLDINYVAKHIGKNSDSLMNAWGVLEDGAFKLFRGTIDFAEGCAGSVGKEKEDVLLLGEHQVNQTIPLILCHEEDVEGDHGATISRLDDQILFYFGSRGIDRETAEDMIARARLEALISRIPDDEVRREAEEMISPTEIRKEA